MFFVLSRYSASPERIAAVLPDHQAWTADLYARGIFVLSGRRVPFEGGFMLARGLSLEELQQLLATDPFRKAALLTHEIVELLPTRWHPALAMLGDPGP